MVENFDVVIIGAGLGGLAAAAELAGAGHQVLILEKNRRVGGTAGVYSRQGFSFPMGPLGFSSPELVRRALEGTAGPLELTRVHYQVRAFGLFAQLSRPREELREQLSALFPLEAEGVGRFFRDMETLAAAQAFPADEANRSLLAEAARTSAREYLDSLVRDRRLRRILGSLGTREPYAGLPLLAAMWRLFSEEGIWYPAGGMASLGERLARAVQSPSELRLGTAVAEIQATDGRATGVVLADGTRIGAGAVISNADFKTTFLRWVDPEALPEEFYRAVFQARQTGSNLQVALGLKADRVDLSAFAEASRVIYRRSVGGDAHDAEEPDWTAVEISPEALAGQELELCLWSADDPMLAPPGGAVLVIRCEAEYSHFSRYRPAPGQRLPGYAGYKERLGRALCREAAKLAPGLSEAIAVMDVATPLTFEERGGRSGGAVAGWSWDFEDSRDATIRELTVTPIAGLYMAGYQAFSSLGLGGVATALLSGQRAARAVMDAAGPNLHLALPGTE